MRSQQSLVLVRLADDAAPAAALCWFQKYLPRCKARCNAEILIRCD